MTSGGSDQERKSDLGRIGPRQREIEVGERKFSWSSPQRRFDFWTSCPFSSYSTSSSRFPGFRSM